MAGCACSGGNGTSGQCCKINPSSSSNSATATASNLNAGASVFLPSRQLKKAGEGKGDNDNANGNENSNKKKAPVWQLENSVPSATAPSTRTEVIDAIVSSSEPLGSKCAVHEREGQCCKDLKGDDERYLISPEVIRDM
jgi:hypothetical protein